MAWEPRDLSPSPAVCCPEPADAWQPACLGKRAARVTGAGSASSHLGPRGGIEGEGGQVSRRWRGQTTPTCPSQAAASPWCCSHHLGRRKLNSSLETRVPVNVGSRDKCTRTRTPPRVWGQSQANTAQPSIPPALPAVFPLPAQILANGRRFWDPVNRSRQLASPASAPGSGEQLQRGRVERSKTGCWQEAT